MVERVAGRGPDAGAVAGDWRGAGVRGAARRFLLLPERAHHAGGPGSGDRHPAAVVRARAAAFAAVPQPEQHRRPADAVHGRYQQPAAVAGGVATLAGERIDHPGRVRNCHVHHELATGAGGVDHHAVDPLPARVLFEPDPGRGPQAAAAGGRTGLAPARIAFQHPHRPDVHPRAGRGRAAAEAEQAQPADRDEGHTARRTAQPGRRNLGRDRDGADDLGWCQPGDRRTAHAG